MVLVGVLALVLTCRWLGIGGGVGLAQRVVVGGAHGMLSGGLSLLLLDGSSSRILCLGHRLVVSRE